MVRFFPLRFCTDSRKKLAVLLALSWCVGIAIGLFCALHADSLLDSLMRTRVDPSVSISGLLAVFSLPLLFSAFAVYTSQFWLLIPLSFLKAFSFSYVGTLFCCLSESGGWLIRFLYLYSDCFASFLLCRLWIRCCNCSRRDGLASCAVTGILFLAVGIADYRLVSPFLYSLLS